MANIFKTHWDVLKDMSMDEFVEWMYPSSYKEIPWCHESCYDGNDMKKCKNCFIEWLNKPTAQINQSEEPMDYTKFNDAMCRLRQGEEDLNRALRDIYVAIHMKHKDPTYGKMLEEEENKS